MHELCYTTRCIDNRVYTSCIMITDYSLLYITIQRQQYIIIQTYFLTTPFFGSEDLQTILSIYIQLQYLLYDAPNGKKVTIMQNKPKH